MKDRCVRLLFLSLHQSQLVSFFVYLDDYQRPEEHPSKRRDFSSKQSWTSPSSSKHSQTLRSDAVALGFTGFEDPFDPGRLLVIQIGSSQADLDANEEIVFLHDEGMALLFGVGLPFSKVVLRSNGEIAVYEVGETKWRQLWIWTDSEIGSVKVFDARATTEGVLQGADSVHAGEIRGRVSDSKQAFKRHPLQSSLSPFSSLWDAISFRLSERGSGGTTPDALLTQMNSSRGFSKAGGRSGVVATEVRIEQQPKREVTIEIYLDSFTCTENCTDYQLSDHRIEPVLVLTFFKEPRGGQILRRFRSALDFRFYMSGEQTVLDSDHEKFGWYHDRLQLSFKCLSGSDVRVDSQGVGSCRIMTGEPDTPGQNMEEGNATSAGGSEHKKAGFHVKSKDSPGEIGSLASIADKYNIWDMGERTSAFRDSGMMANALFTLTGNWTIWSEGLTNYVLLGTRDFILKMRGTKPPRSVGFSRQDSELRVSQEIRKVFKVDHSFTFFEELSDWQAWPMAVYAVAPHPISGMVDAVPESCPGNRVSGGAIVQSQTVPRTGEQTFSASDENQDSHEVAPTSEITTTLRVFTKDHLNGERVATKLNDYIYELSTTMEPDMEIVFCHGLNLDDSNNLHLSTWTSDDVGKLHVWPKTWLAEDFPHARVLTVSYDSSLYQTPELGRIGLHNTAENLMSNLLLEADPSSVHPLILVGYSFGGILIKQLCLHAYEKIASRYHRVQSEAFLERINAIYFMGTPHSGMIHEGFEVPRQENAGPLFKDVKLLNEELARLQQKFHNLRETYAWQISSVAESYMTRWGEFEGELVPEGSARYGSGELFATVPADHRSLSKASEKNCTVYKQLKALITQAYSKVCLLKT
ncbi:hypothetical protein R1sor_004774 [Riccia sorocarpa]|uniref:Uncharacterized protein n=1 Tax=Riccia sorocarpa TaxID=122646 RepID=A0ABD3HI87_9MARC